MIWEKPVTTVGANFGLSGNAIKKWCKEYGIKTPPPGHWQKLWRGNYPKDEK